MVVRTRELEAALGSPRKFVADNEKETIVLQRRCLRATRDLSVGIVLQENDFEALRPAPTDAVMPYDADKICGRTVRQPKVAGEHFMLFDFD